MKNKNALVFIVIFVFIIDICYSQSREIFFFPKKTKSNKSAIPPLTIKLNDSIFIDVAPVDNLMYSEFLTHLKFFWTERIHDSIKKMPNFGVTKDMAYKVFENIPNNNQLWVSQKIPPNLMVNNSINSNDYLEHPKYSFYPAVNISKEQAALYCKWRTDVVKLNWALNTKNLKKRRKNPLDFIYRLPTKKELLTAISKFGYSNSTHKKDLMPLSPYRTKYKSRYNKALFYKDRISEFVLDSLPFGSNWRKKESFNTPNDYTGFRCVCYVKD
jgi:hypothetical protein